MEHTPGPWEYLAPHAVGGAEIVPVTGGPCIHTFWNENPDLRDDQEHEANAHLIAAAPELLEALRPFAHLTKVLEEGQMLNFRGVYVGFEDARSAAAAIDKATGKETP